LGKTVVLDLEYRPSRSDLAHSFFSVCMRAKWPATPVLISGLRTFAPIATAHRYCARKFTCPVIHRARELNNKITMLGKMAIATALRGFNDLRHSVTPKFFPLFTMIYTWSKNEQKLSVGVKKISRFLYTRHRILPSCDSKVPETMAAKFELVL